MGTSGTYGDLLGKGTGVSLFKNSSESCFRSSLFEYLNLVEAFLLVVLNITKATNG